ncbi:universal stress protein [Methanoregula sp.]|uniref:universal stress protein n=1 Tax=Methanoregula sp. TaxID=2052170 RepID=UPI002373A298|nr:universal stress protein [Methanoregula sp.]MDD1687427.1 universal stress protein [Methanoregula sp.]
MTNRIFEKILIATDGSEKNRAAVDEALRIGRGYGSTVFAVYVMDLSAFKSASADMVIRDTWAVVQKEAETALDRVRALAEGVTLETVTLDGKPAAEIVKFAQEKGIDLIVIGTRGKQGLERLLLGSVAEQVIRTAPCKVLVVK